MTVDELKKRLHVGRSVKHGLTGKPSNAAKQEGKSEAFLHIRCKTDDKNAWVKQAQAEGKKLSTWIIERLNKRNEQ